MNLSNWIQRIITVWLPDERVIVGTLIAVDIKAITVKCSVPPTETEQAINTVWQINLADIVAVATNEQ